MPQDGCCHDDATIALIALGSNATSRLGGPEITVRAGLERLAAGGIAVCRASALYRTPCFPPGAGPDYVNAAAVVVTRLEPAALLRVLHRIEADLGRERVQRWGQRTLDLDLLAHGDSVLPDAATQHAWRDLAPDAQMRSAPDRLILPHPRMQDRAFVLVPLAEVAPEWHHPLTGLSVRQMLAELAEEDRRGIVRLRTPAGPPREA